jgi:release factor glutamine methyltransferase
MTETSRSVLKLAAEWLGKKGVDSSRLDAELLLAHALKVKRLDLYLDMDRPLTETELEPFRVALRRRAAREPLAYIAGEREFYGLAFEVTKDVLVPRPETEHLVSVALEEVERGARRFCDVGTGSGCVAISILKKKAEAVGVATDLSEGALAVAQRNVARHGVTLELVKADLLEGVAGPFDLVVSNPPYVLPSERPGLEPELSFEPQGALFDTAEDLPTTRRLAEQARAKLKPGGLLAVETGAGRAALVRGHLEKAGFVEIDFVKDLAGHERIVRGRTAS